MCFKSPKCDGIPSRRCDGSFEDGDEVLYLPGANLPPGGWDGLGEMEVVGHFTVHGLSVSVSVNTGGVQANINTNNNVIDAMTSFLQATMSANTGDVHDATINFVNAFMNADNNTTAAMNFLSAIAVMPSPATDAEPAPVPALEAVSEVQEEEEEVEEVEQAEEFIVTAGEGAETVEAGRDALGNVEGEESEEAAEVALEDSGFQGDSTEVEVGSAVALPPPAVASSSNSFANCCGLM